MNKFVTDTAKRRCSLQRIEVQHPYSDSSDEGGFYVCSLCGLSMNGSFYSMFMEKKPNIRFSCWLKDIVTLIAIAQVDVMTESWNFPTQTFILETSS